MRGFAVVCCLGLTLAGGCARQRPRGTDNADGAASTAAPETRPGHDAPAATESTPIARPDPPPPRPPASGGEDPAPAASKPSRKQILNKCLSGVVVVTAFDALGDTIGLGSGCVVAPGTVLTNHHVVAEAVKVQVQPRGAGGEPVGTPVEVEGYRGLDERNDLAALAVRGLPESLHVLPVAAPDTIAQFDEVFAIGHPDGLKFSTTPGFVNGTVKTSDLPAQLQQALAGRDTEWIQTDAVIAGGSSGGPLLNEAGEIVGINTLLLTNRMGLAVSARHVLDLLRQLERDSTVEAFPVPDANVLTTRAVAELSEGFMREFQQFAADVQGAGSDVAARRRVMEGNNPVPGCVRVCCDIVRQQPGSPESVDALRFAARILSASGRSFDGRHYLDDLLGEAAEDPALIPSALAAVNALAGLPHSPELERYLRRVIDDGETPAVRATAGVVLIGALTNAGAEDLGAEAMELSRLVADRFGVERCRGSTVREHLKEMLAAQQVAVGSIAPEIRGADADGVPFSLSDYRGKVVVLDFWADWCPHCRAAYAGQRALVERFKDRPFALLGVNSDEPDRAKRVITAGTVNWRSWLDGTKGPIAERYRIESVPTVYVLDAEGHIRHDDLRGEQLAEAVARLLGDRDEASAGDIVATGAEWRSLVARDDVDPEAWKAADFDDAGWMRGPTPFGFGPVSAESSLDLGEAGARPATVLFRTTFDRPDRELPPRLVMSTRHLDGIVVHLNGSEVFRELLPARSAWTTRALWPASRGSTERRSVPIDAALLRPTGNCIAVELHSASPHRAKALFDLSLRVPPDPAALEGELSESRKAELCSLLGDIGADLRGARESLARWQEDPAAAVRLRAAVAAGMNGLPIRAPDPRNPEALLPYAAFLLQTRARALALAERGDLSDDQYARLERVATTIRALAAKLPDAARVGLEDADSIRGIALYRCRRWEAAREAFDSSVARHGSNPVDLAFLAMLNSREGNEALAIRQRDESLALFDDDRWKHRSGRRWIIDELESAFAEAAP